jgi:hypothetical protein
MIFLHIDLTDYFAPAFSHYFKCSNPDYATEVSGAGKKTPFRQDKHLIILICKKRSIVFGDGRRAAANQDYQAQTTDPSCSFSDSEIRVLDSGLQVGLSVEGVS